MGEKMNRLAALLAVLVVVAVFAMTATEAGAKINTEVFPGYFKNVDYSNPELFLQCGDQTRITPEIQQVADGFNDAKDISTVMEIFQWMRANLRLGDGEKFGRTSQEIITSGVYTGCTDMGLIFASLARAKGIPTVFLQTARADWIELVSSGANPSTINGHILVEVYLNGRWYLVDSTAGKLFLDYDNQNMSLGDGYYVFAKSIEVWDTGVKNEQENRNIMHELFRDFDPSLYENPKYDYIDLATGERKKSWDFEFRNAVLIAGRKDPVELFDSRFTGNFASKLMTDFFQISSYHVRGADRMVLLYTPDQEGQVTDCLREAVPEINSSCERFAMSTYRNGQRVILVKAPTEDELLDAIEKLPADILDRDYFNGGGGSDDDWEGHYILQNHILKITFSAPLDMSSVSEETVFVRDQDGKIIDFDWACNENFVFLQPLVTDLSKTYTVVVKAGIRSESGVPMSEDFTWDFRVKAGTCCAQVNYR